MIRQLLLRIVSCVQNSALNLIKRPKILRNPNIFLLGHKDYDLCDKSTA